MKTYHLERPGRIEGLVLRSQEQPRPGPTQILLRVRANALNYRDLMVVREIPVAPTMRTDLIPLSDGAGEVVEVGADVTRCKVGDRVAAIFRQNWLEGEYVLEAANSDLGGGTDGMLSEYVVLNQDGVVQVPAHLSFDEAATLPSAGVTAWNAIVTKGRTIAGDTVLVQGSGGVSVFALQFAKLQGARVIATTSSETKAQRLKTLGADEVINYKATPDWDREVLRLTNGRGADVVMDAGGAGTLPKSCASARVGGRVVLMGLLAQGHEISTVSELFFTMFVRDLNVVSVHAGSRADFEAMNRAIAQHRLRPVIDRRFAFESVHDAYRHLESQAHFGKVVISHERVGA